MISDYNFRATHYQESRPIQQWAESGFKNYMTFWLSFHFLGRNGATISEEDWAAVMTVLRSFWYVGTTENWDRDCSFVCSHIGVPFKSIHTHETETSKVFSAEQLEALNTLDRRLFDAWKGAHV